MLSLNIFWVFFKISLVSFGGMFATLTRLEHLICVEQQWLSHERFIQAFAIAQFVPGPNIAMGPLIGYWVNGWSGFWAAFAGAYLAPVFLVGSAGFIYQKYRNIKWVKKCEIALRPVALGLVSATVVRLWLSQTGPAQFLFEFRMVASLMSAVGIYLYSKKKISSMSLIVAFGIVWWLANWAVPQFFR